MGATEIVAVVGRDLDELATMTADEFPKIPELIRSEGPVHITLLALDDRQRERARRIRRALRDPEVMAAAGGALSLRVVGAAAGVSSLAEFVGDRPDLLGDRGDSSDDLEPVLFNAVSGPEEQRSQLEVLLDGYEVHSIHRSAEGSVYVTRRQALRRSHLISALHFVRTAGDDEQSRARVDAERFHGLVVGPGTNKPGGAFRETAALLRLVGSERLKVQPDYHSASADLLDRLGDHERAAKLRRLIRRWLKNRLWSGNLVPEMVLHDEDHAVAVDRNVAFICEPIVRPLDTDKGDPGTGGTDGLTTEDLFVLAAAAWLHDCGHSSAKVGTQYEIGAVAVRELHGYLSYLRLKEEDVDLHGLTNRVVKANTRDDGVRSRTRSRVRLLCAHHQGKSSFDRAPGMLGTPKHWDHDPAIPFFDHVVEELALSGERPTVRDATYELMKRMLAILRVADAADVGVHRVPDFASRKANHEPVVFRVINDLVRNVSLAEKVGTSAGAAVYERSMASIVEDQFEHYKDLVDRIASEWRWSEDEVSSVVDKFEMDRKLGKYARKPPSLEGLDLITDLAKRRAWDYAQHVAKQSGYYSSHARYEVVFPFLLGNAKGWTLTLAAQPSVELKNRDSQSEPIGGGVDSRTHLQRAQEYLLDIVVREFGSKTQTLGFTPSDGDKAKYEVPLRLNDLAIHVQPPGWTWIKGSSPVDAGPDSGADALMTTPLRPGLTAVLRDGDEYVVLSADSEGVVHPIWADVAEGAAPLHASPEGDRLATLHGRRLTFHDLDEGREVRETSLVNLDDAGGRLLAMGGYSGIGAAVISWPDGTLTVDEAGNPAIVSNDECIAAAVVRGHVVSVDTAGAAHAHLFGSDDTPSSVPWLEGVRVIDVDAVVIEGRAIVVALGEQGGVWDVRVAELHEDGTWEQRTGQWEQSQPERDFRGAKGVALVRCTAAGLVALMIRDGEKNEVLWDDLDDLPKSDDADTRVAPQ